MADVSAADVKRLREKTGAGMMECKNALVQTGGDFDEAEKLLKEKGLAAMEKRADRETTAGRVFVEAEGPTAVAVEISSETDFVSRNPDFVALGEAVAKKALAEGASAETPELVGMVNELATRIRENMGLRRLVRMTAGDGGYIAKYVHGEGEIGVLVGLTCEKAGAFDDEETRAFAFSLALHVAAFAPLSLDRGRIDPAYLAEQEDIFRKQMEQDEKLVGKPANVLEGILKGKLNKHLSDICLMDQGYVKDEKMTVAQAIEEQSKRIGGKLAVSGFEYLKVGA